MRSLIKFTSAFLVIATYYADALDLANQQDLFIKADALPKITLQPQQQTPQPQGNSSIKPRMSHDIGKNQPKQTPQPQGNSSIKPRAPQKINK